MPSLSDYRVTIQARFISDVEQIALDMLQSADQAWLSDDYAIVQEIIDASEADAGYRLDLATDSAAWQGFQVGRVDVMADSLIRWDLDPTAQHCDDCLAYAAGGPYTIDTLPGIPGQAPTICDGSCRCNLVPE